LKKIDLLRARVDTLEEDNSVLQEKVHKLQEKTKALAKEKKGNFSSFGLAVDKLTKIQADTNKQLVASM